MKHYSFFCLFALIVLVGSCTNNTSNPWIFFNTFNDGQSISLASDTLHKYTFTIYVDTIQAYKGEFSGKTYVDIIKALKYNKGITKDIALYAMKNNGIISIKVAVQDLLDTTINFTIPFETEKPKSVTFTGPGAVLYNTSSNPNDAIELKKWLFSKKEYMSDSLIRILTGYYQTLNRSNYDEYRTQQALPVLHSIEGCKYKIDSEMMADYYALIACSSQDDIDTFVENLVANNFVGVATSLSSSIACYDNKETCGYKCLVLLGINKDWSYIQQPIGLLAIDNEAPYNGFDYRHDEKDYIDFKDNQRIMLPFDKPSIFGNASVYVANWDGNGLECNVTFQILFEGDVKSITIRRRGDLCYREFSGGYYLKQEDKIINTKEHETGYIFTYKMHFDDGDNIIPVIYEDYHGNIRNARVRVRASFTYNTAPSINIDNNIEIDN